MKHLLAFLLLSVSFACAQSSQAVDTRGALHIAAPPVVSHITENAAEVRWTTKQPQATDILYGTDPARLVLHSALQDHDVEHEIALENLQAHTVYYFEVRDPNGGSPYYGSFTTR